MRIGLNQAERKDVYGGFLDHLERPVEAKNSTVLGRNARTDHDARQWFDGWQNLGVNDERTYSDGTQKKNTKYGMFGVGRNQNFSCGEYLHCPVMNEEEGDNRYYRVRSRIQPGDILCFGRRIKTNCMSVSVRKVEGIWHWVYRFTKVSVII